MSNCDRREYVFNAFKTDKICDQVSDAIVRGCGGVYTVEGLNLTDLLATARCLLGSGPLLQGRLRDRIQDRHDHGFR